MAEEKKKKTGPKPKQAVTKAMQNAFLDCPNRTSYQNKTITPAVLDYIIEQMLGDNGKWTKAFIDSQLKEAKEHPNSLAAGRLSAAIFNEYLWDKMDKYLTDANKEDINYAKYLIRQTLYDKQQQVFDDETSQRCLIINSRRSGKTELMGRLIVKGLLEPDAHIVYINRNSSAAIRQIRGPFEDALKALCGRISITNGSVGAQEVHFSNGTQLLILGNNNSADIDKLRGERISMCILDECGHQRNMRQLLREVIGPALKDYGKASRLYMVGTPPRIPRTYVEEIWNDAISLGWKKYHWTFEDNPFIPDRDKVIEDVCKENGVTPDSAFIQREYYGKMGVYDTEAVVFKGYKTYNSLNDILSANSAEIKLSDDEKTLFRPTGVYIGIDWGGTDYNAIVSVVVDSLSKQALVYDVWAERKCGLEIIKSVILSKYNQAQALLYNYGIDENEQKIKIITDTNMVEFAVDLHKLGLPVEKAYKYDMMTSVETMATELRTGRCRVPSEWKPESNRLIQDLNDTVYKRDEETDVLLREIDDDTYHPDAAHALRYAMRQWMEDGNWVYGKAKSTPSVDPTKPANLEDFIETGKVIDTSLPPWLRKNEKTAEEFVV